MTERFKVSASNESSHFPELRKWAIVVLWKELFLAKSVVLPWYPEIKILIRMPIRCMILSGHQRFDYAQKALKLHCASYVLKPIDKTQLCDEIRHALELKQNHLIKSLQLPYHPLLLLKQLRISWQRMKTLFSVYEPISIPIYPILIWTVLLLQNICIWVQIAYLMYFIRNLTRLLVLTLHPCALIRQRSFLKEPTGEWILLQKKLDFPAAPTFINNSKK